MRPLPPLLKIPSRRQHQSNDHLWSVSYSDMLMVLLGFFVIFFGQGQDVAKDVLDIIAVDMNHGNSTNSSQKTSESLSSKSLIESTAAPTVGDHQDLPIEQIGATIRESLSYSSVVIEPIDNGRVIRITFPQMIFVPGGTNILPQAQVELDSVMTTLMPYFKMIHIHIVGHADQTNVVIPGNWYTNNFELSAIRAAQIAQVFDHHGFAKENIVISGGADNIRDARSLTLLISLGETDTHLKPRRR